MEFEKEYAPMFVNSRGKAMSYESYRKKFKSLVNDHLRPALLASEDPELRIYGQLLCENSLGLIACGTGSQSSWSCAAKISEASSPSAGTGTRKRRSCISRTRGILTGN